jgi:kinesin family protein 18/19
MKDNRSKSTNLLPVGNNTSKHTIKNLKKTSSINKKISESDTNNFKDSMRTGKSNILVAVRCRPLTSKEIAISKEETLKILNKKVVCVIDPGTQDDVFKNKLREQQYAFDFAFDKNSTQLEVYENTTKFLLPGILEGFNTTVFAYGATGAGKTYTMLGTGDNPGIMVRSLSDLFSMIDETKAAREFRIKLSYVEIYNESLRDLIEKGENLEMREDPNKGIQIVGLTEIEVTNVTEVFKLLLKGNRNRTTEATNVNESSSRSHAVLQIRIDNKLSSKTIKNQNDETIIGKFILVDLAGSERAANTQNTRLRLVEGGNINKSLLNLGTCINALVEISNGSEKTFVPWRNSKLTRMLKV